MAVVSTEAVPSSITTLRKRVRRATTDRNTDTARQRWSDADVDQAIIDMLFQMYAEMNLATTDFIKTSTVTYTANADSYTLADGLQTNLIYAIEDVTQPLAPILLGELEPAEADALGSPSITFSLYWFHMPGAIALRPIPSMDRQIKIFFMSNPMTPYTYDSSGNPTTTATNQHPYPVQHEELIVIGAAVRLQEEINAVPDTRMRRFNDLWEQFVRFANANGGPARVTQKRSWL